MFHYAFRAFRMLRESEQGSEHQNTFDFSHHPNPPLARDPLVFFFYFRLHHFAKLFTRIDAIQLIVIDHFSFRFLSDDSNPFPINYASTSPQIRLG